MGDNKFGYSIDAERHGFFKGIGLFNRWEFFAAHDEWEEIWSQVQDRRREQFYRAIIKGAVSLVLLQSGRAVGTRQVFVDCVDEFEGLPEIFMGLDIPKHIENLRNAIGPSLNDLSATSVRIDTSRLFKMRLLYDPFRESRNDEGADGK